MRDARRLSDALREASRALRVAALVLGQERRHDSCEDDRDEGHEDTHDDPRDGAPREDRERPRDFERRYSCDDDHETHRYPHRGPHERERECDDYPRHVHHGVPWAAHGSHEGPHASAPPYPPYPPFPPYAAPPPNPPFPPFPPYPPYVFITPGGGCGCTCGATMNAAAANPAGASAASAVPASGAAPAAGTAATAATTGAVAGVVAARPSSLASQANMLASHTSAFPNPASLPNFDALLELGEKAAEMVLERVPSAPER